MRWLWKYVEYILKELAFLLTGKDADMASAGVADYSGQGRDRYGK